MMKARGCSLRNESSNVWLLPLVVNIWTSHRVFCSFREIVGCQLGVTVPLAENCGATVALVLAALFVLSMRTTLDPPVWQRLESDDMAAIVPDSALALSHWRSLCSFQHS